MPGLLIVTCVPCLAMSSVPRRPQGRESLPHTTFVAGSSVEKVSEEVGLGSIAMVQSTLQKPSSAGGARIREMETRQRPVRSSMVGSVPPPQAVRSRNSSDEDRMVRLIVLIEASLQLPRRVEPAGIALREQSLGEVHPLLRLAQLL